MYFANTNLSSLLGGCGVNGGARFEQDWRDRLSNSCLGGRALRADLLRYFEPGFAKNNTED